MNKYLNGSLMFTSGCMIGGIITFFICRSMYKSRIEQIKEEDQQYYLDLLGYSEEENVTEIIDDKKSEETELKNLSEEDIHKMSYTEFMDRKKNEAIRNRERIKYDKVPKNYEDPEVDETEMIINNDQQDLDISIITSDQFAREYGKYDKETLLWWPRNNLITTEDFEILDIPELLGNDWINRIGEFEPNMVYVRNKVAEKDFEICQQNDDYYDYKE